MLVFGGAGFVGLNLAEALLAAGRSVTIFDRSPVPEAARRAFSGLPGRLETIAGDVTDEAAVAAAIRPGLDALVLGAAITADAARDAREPERILAVNLASLVAILRGAREAGVRRVVNLSSAAAYGWKADPGDHRTILSESDPADPSGFYGLTKLAGEKLAARLGSLWDIDVVSARLSGVFGPWERETGVRDTLSPHAQILALARAGLPALLPRPGRRDWVYGPDVAAALLLLIGRSTLRHRLYNLSSPTSWPALAWGQRLQRAFPGFVCRLAEPGETPSVDLHARADRPPLDTSRLTAELGWTARFGLENSCDDLLAHLSAEAGR